MVVKREKLLSNTQYRWEFLKRDPNYIQTYDKYRKSSPKKRVEWEFVIKNKFGLISPLDPYDKSLFNESYFEDDFKMLSVFKMSQRFILMIMEILL